MTLKFLGNLNDIILFSKYIITNLKITDKIKHVKMSGDMPVNNEQAAVIKYLEDNLKKYPDFPKPGIVFR